MSGHTAGPWFVVHELREGDEIVADLDNETWVVVQHNLGGWNEDARLISAAPDLLDALGDFVNQWNACGPNSDFGRYFSSVREVARAAIAKATGGKT